MSRHRGAKPCRRCGLLGKISLLSPEYLLSVERRPFRSGPPDRLEPTFVPARLVGLAVRLACTLALRGRLPTVLSQPCARLRYSLGGDRPSQTTRLARSPALLQGSGLGRRRDEGSIPRSPPRGLAPPLRGLLPILYATRRRPMPSCSKGSRGLSVLPRVIRIFTNSAISPGPWSRQRPSRYAVRAGRNLPDKEFRYLRTVIVTAAVYRGLGSPLRLAADGSP